MDAARARGRNFKAHVINSCGVSTFKACLCAGAQARGGGAALITSSRRTVTRPGRPPPSPAVRLGACHGPVATLVRPELRYRAEPGLSDFRLGVRDGPSYPEIIRVSSPLTDMLVTPSTRFGH